MIAWIPLDVVVGRSPSFEGRRSGLHQSRPVKKYIVCNRHDDEKPRGLYKMHYPIVCCWMSLIMLSGLGVRLTVCC